MSTLFSKILLVEDEISLGQALSIALEEFSTEVVWTQTIAQGAKHLPESQLIVLDRQLPDGDGLQICRMARERQIPVVILCLTAAADIHEKITGLDAGADDYLTKPFSWDELRARVRALARRIPTQATPPEKGLWVRDPDQLRILGPKGWVTLTPLEYQLACKLIAAPDRILSRALLLKEVWGFTLLPQTRTVDHFMGRLRKGFELDPENPKHFLTVRGAGYKFCP